MKNYKDQLTQIISDYEKINNTRLSQIEITHYGFNVITYKGQLDWEAMEKAFTFNSLDFGWRYQDELLIPFSSTLTFEDGSKIGFQDEVDLEHKPATYTFLDNLFAQMFKPANL